MIFVIIANIKTLNYVFGENQYRRNALCLLEYTKQFLKFNQLYFLANFEGPKNVYTLVH